MEEQGCWSRQSGYRVPLFVHNTKLVSCLENWGNKAWVTWLRNAFFIPFLTNLNGYLNFTVRKREIKEIPICFPPFSRSFYILCLLPQWRVIENRTALVSSHVINKHALSTNGMPSTVPGDRETKGKSAAFPPTPCTPFTPDHMEALWRKDRKISFKFSMGPCSLIALPPQSAFREACVSSEPNPTLSFAKRAFSSLDLLCWFAPETASTLFLTPGHTCQQQLVTFQKLVCFYIAGFHFNSFLF